MLSEPKQEQLDQAQSEMLFYEVGDIEKFLDMYEVPEDERERIISRWNDGEELYVFQDGRVIWQDGDLLVEPDDSLMNEEDFAREVARCGAVFE